MVDFDMASCARVADLRFEQLFQRLPIACYCFDENGCVLEWNRACETLFVRGGASIHNKPAWTVVGRPEDEELFLGLVRSVLSGLSFDVVEWQDSAADGSLRYFQSSFFPLMDDSGVVTGGIAANTDISERKVMEFAIAASEERWQFAVRGTSDGIWDWNALTNEMFYSSRWKQMLGYDEEDVPADPEVWLNLLHPDEKPGVTQAYERHIRGEVTRFSTEHRLRRKDGSYLWVLNRGQAIWNTHGKPMRVAGSITDISERKYYESQLHEANEKLAALATEDGLTGLKNYRTFNEQLTLELERGRRYHQPVSLILADVDHFKQYNDMFGHVEGDAVLQRVAALLADSVRDVDLVARYGGEEFVLLLPNTDAKGASLVAERCRLTIEKAKWTLRPIAMSFGVATFKPDVEGTAGLVAIADRALYVSKQSGRNRVSHADQVVGRAFLGGSFAQAPNPAAKRRTSKAA